MKHYNLFDFYEGNETLVDEATVLENTGVNYENIKTRVFQNINKSKRKSHKKARIMALVAVLVVIISFSTTATYATGKFSDVFGYLFSGECENGLYSGGNVVIECSDDSLNVEVMGISAGSESEVYVAYKLTKKDGSDFDFPGDNFENGEVYFDIDEASIDYPFDGLFMGSSNGSLQSSCTVQDEKTIILYQSYNAYGNAVRGQRMSSTFKKLCFKQVDKHLGEYVEVEDSEEIEVIEQFQPVNGSTDSNEYYNALMERMSELQGRYTMDGSQSLKVIKNKDGIDEICMVTYIWDYEAYQKEVEEKTQKFEKQLQLGENQIIETIYVEELDKEEFCIVNYREYDVTINSEIDLNYKENVSEYTVDSETAKTVINSDRAEVNSAKVLVSPFSVIFDCKFIDQTYYTRNIVENSYNNKTKIEQTNIIRMNDGTEYYLLNNGAVSVGYTTSEEIEMSGNYIISLTNNEDSPEMVAIDMDNVKEIEINGVIISVA